MCVDCNETKEITQFNKKGKTSSGKPDYQSYCKDCYKLRRRKYYENNHDAAIARSVRTSNRLAYELQLLKSKLKCDQCGESDPRCLEFHHRDPSEKIEGVRHLWHKSSKKTAMDEMEKCDILCANCHRKHHHKLFITDQDVADLYPMIGEDI